LRNAPTSLGKQTLDNSVLLNVPASTKLGTSGPNIYYPPKDTVRIAEVLQKPAVNIRPG